jgi:hypothetical protein
LLFSPSGAFEKTYCGHAEQHWKVTAQHRDLASPRSRSSTDAPRPRLFDPAFKPHGSRILLGLGQGMVGKTVDAQRLNARQVKRALFGIGDRDLWRAWLKSSHC